MSDDWKVNSTGQLFALYYIMFPETENLDHLGEEFKEVKILHC